MRKEKWPCAKTSNIGKGSMCIHKGHLNNTAFTVSLVGRASDFRSQGCGFESHCEQDFFILHFFFAFHALLAGGLVPYK